MLQFCYQQDSCHANQSAIKFCNLLFKNQHILVYITFFYGVACFVIKNLLIDLGAISRT